MFYESRGGGEPLVLIPGFASGSWSWSWQVDELAQDFRVITFDPRGIAKSKIAEDETVSIPVIADDVAALLDELRIESAHVLGISFGGFVAQEFALRYPERVMRLVLASTSFGGPNHISPSMSVLAAFSATDGLETPERIRKYLTVAFSPEFVRTDGAAVERFCRLREENVISRATYTQQLEAALSFNLENDVSKISVETLVITGETDVVVPAENSQNLAAAIPNAVLKTIGDTGHMAFVEKAGEFNRIVRDFLKPPTASFGN